RAAGEFAELGDEVRLVGVAEVGGDAGPLRMALAPRRVEHAPEARHAREGLRADANAIEEAEAKVLPGDAELARDLLDAHAADEAVDGVVELLVEHIAGSCEKRVLDDVDLPCRRRRLGNALAEGIAG